MIFIDLDCLEIVIKSPNIVGGAGEFDYSTYVAQYVKSDQYSSAISDAESQFKDAIALAVSYNSIEIEQS